MKNRLLVILLSVVMCLTVVSCGGEKGDETTKAPETSVPAETTLASAPEATPEATTGATPEVTPEVIPDATTEVTPEVIPEITSEATTPEASTAEVTVETTENGEETEPLYVRPTGEQRIGTILYTIIDAHLESINADLNASAVGVTLRYYGEYGNSNSFNVYVMFIDNPTLAYTEALWSDTVGSQTFNYFNGQQLEVYIADAHNSKLCTLKEAYEEGYISDDRLAKLNERYTSGNPIVIMEDDPALEDVKEDLFMAYFDNNKLVKATLHSCGCYNGAYVVYINYLRTPHFEMVHDVQIGDYTIRYLNSQNMTVYYEGNFYDVEDAFDRGIITNDDVAVISEIHNAQLFVTTARD